jgi:class 3 adenylate cyclase
MSDQATSDETSCTATVMFADVCGSTKLYETLGDARARNVMARCIAIMTEVTERRGGRLVKTIGDEVMATFPETAAAADAACEMQDSITGEMLVDGRPVAIRIGFHLGPVIEEAGDVFGDTVNVAARMAGLAKPEQIVMAESTMQALPARQRAMVRQMGVAEVAGKREPVAIFELLVRPEDATLIPGQAAWGMSAPQAARLLVSASGTRLELSARLPSLTMGRANDNDIVLVTPLISRLHARLDFRRGRFELTDLSSNGTFVKPDSGDTKLLRRDHCELVGSGRLGLGEAVGPESINVIRYIVL